MSRPALRLLLALLPSLTIACAPQRPASELGASPGIDSDPVAAIIERRPELQLADTQVSELRVLKRDLDRANRPLREELERLGLIRPPANVRVRAVPPTKEQQEQARPIVSEIRDNNRRAREAAMAILTAAQRTRLDSLDRAMRDQRPSNRGGGRPHD